LTIDLQFGEELVFPILSKHSAYNPARVS